MSQITLLLQRATLGRATLGRAALGAAAVLLTCTAQAQTTSPSAPSATSGDRTTPAAVVRQQTAQIARGDPGNWHQEDTSPQARMRTLRKDIAAGLRENLGVCKLQPAAERSACTKEARATYRQDMADLGRIK